jgi:tight adherence protein B
MSANLAVLELAALLRSGATTSSAIKVFQEQSLSEFQKNQFRFIWEVARESGGNLALSLDRLAEVFDAQQKQNSELKLAFASPRATANLILLLPLAAVLFAELLGLSALSSSFETSLGSLAVGVGLVLLIVARIVSLRMLEKAKPREADPGAFLDAVVICLSAGLSPKSAAALATRQSLENLDAEVSPEQLSAFWDAVAVSEQSGIALTGILSARADALRHRLWNRRRTDLARLSISLLLPLGLAALPAFVFLAVVPVGIGLFRGT